MRRFARGGLIRAVWQLSRPPLWMVSILPLYLGHMLATRELFPGLERWAAFVAMGPLAWAATLCLNDAYDADSDRLNPRKASSPLVVGLVSTTFSRRAAYVFAAAALAAAGTLGWAFFALVAAVLGLGWAYSVPPLRLKERPGADLATVVASIGVVAPLAGWAIARPLSQFPWIVLAQGVLVATAVYIPSTLVDLAADRASGTKTIATALGRDRAYAIGWYAWLTSCAGSLILAAGNMIVPRRMLPVLAVTLPLLIWEYHRLIGRARDEPAMVRGIVICSLTFAGSNLCFALMYTDVWR